MTCAEARRQLSAPDLALAAEIDAHLDGCAPCRGESESLKEVDRRIGRLGEVRRNAARAAYLRSQSLGRAASPGRPSRGAPPVPPIALLSPASPQSAHGASKVAAAQRPSAELHGAEPTIGRWLLMLIVPALLVPAILWWVLHARH